MTEYEAVEIAREYLAKHGIQGGRIGDVRHATIEALDNMFQAYVSKRSAGEQEIDEFERNLIEWYRRERLTHRNHWVVHVTIDGPDEVTCPGGPTILVYDDTGDADRL
jgi:hypothetical protein